MGFGSWLRSKASCVCGCLKTICTKTWEAGCDLAKKGKDAAVSAAKWVGHRVSKAWKGFTGESTAEKAEAKYAELKERIRKKEEEFADFALKKECEINAELEKINNTRIRLNDDLFARYEDIASNFANLEVVSVKGDKLIKAVRKSIKVKAKAELFKIDFRNHKVKTTLQALGTLGFWTRKRATQSLRNVEAEELRIEKDFAELDNEKERLEGVLSTLRSVSRYLTQTAKTYSRVLDELDYSVMFLRSCRRVVSNGAHLRPVFDVEFLPERQLLTLMCADKATRIIHTMASQQYVKADGKRFVIDEKELAVWSEKKVELKEQFERMAA